MNKEISSFWGNINYIGRAGVGAAKVVIAGYELVVRDGDEGLKGLRTSSGGKKYFLVAHQIMPALYEIVAVYGSSKADQRLVLSLREVIEQEELTAEDLRDWKPDYLIKGFR